MNSSLTARVPADPVGTRNTLLRKMLNPAPGVELIGPGDSQRIWIEAMIAEKFRGAWQAEVTHFLPWLLALNCMK